MKTSLFISAAALALLASGVAVFADAIADRQKIMKSSGEALYRDIGKTVKGDIPFDLAKIQADLEVLANAAEKMPALFPPDSKKGGDTKAMATIWESKADFEAHWQALGKVVADAKAQVKDIDSLKAVQPKLLQSCDSCHKDYRARSS